MPERHWVDLGKYLFIGWAIPFFYISTFFFLIKGGYDKRPLKVILLKMKNILILLTVSVIVEEALKILSIKGSEDNRLGMWHLLQSFDFLKLLNVLLTGNNTPAYFLAQLLILYIPLYAVGKLMNKYFIIGFSLTLTSSYIAMNEKAFDVYFGEEVFLYLIISTILMLLIGLKRKLFRKQPILIISLLMIYCVWRLQHQEFIFTGIVLLYSFHIISNKPRIRFFSSSVSQFGQQHSLFVFISHTFFLQAMGSIINKLLLSLNLSETLSMEAYILVNLSSFMLASLTSIAMRKFWNIKIQL
jgi:hypothetical protein